MVFYYYYDRAGAYGNPMFSGNSANIGYTGTTGNGLVSGPGDAQLHFISYAQMNSVAQNWVINYTIARCALVLSMMRGTYSELPIPGASVTMNADQLMGLFTSERDRLFKKLEDDLAELSYQKIMENRAAVQESISKTLGYTPMGIYIF
jgi:hypothetical protein